ncbi:MAG: PEGA domain-containing protein [Myxococcales bacterium]|nr:PEGA domain-containing protein [Myxococcales bacterium]
MKILPREIEFSEKNLSTIDITLWACLAASVFCVSKPLYASNNGLDIAQELRIPGVKLLAVEFFATWCAPCMKAIPRWKALHEKYRDEGLRFVVVVSRDPEGACTNPGWTPDRVICDDEGFLQERFGAQSLPAAFLWGWQGHMLGHHAHVDAVEAHIIQWMKRSPRVAVEAGTVDDHEITREQLAEMVRGQLVGQGKFTIVATEEERQRLRKLRQKSLDLNADERLACNAGKEVSANSWLKVSLTGKVSKRLRLELFSAERGCLEAHGTAPWFAKRPVVSINQALSAITRAVSLPKVQLPFAPSRPPQPAPSPPKRLGRISVTSVPPGLEVVLNGRPTGQKTPTQFSNLAMGTHQISARIKGEIKGIQKIELNSQKTTENVSIELETHLTALNVQAAFQGQPVEAKLLLDGKLVGNTPFKGLIEPGIVELNARTSTFEGAQLVRLEPGSTQNINLQLVEKKKNLPRRLMLFGGGAAAAVGAGVFFTLAEMQVGEAREARFNSDFTDSEQNTVDTFRTVGIGSAVAAGALLSTGLIFELVNGRQQKKKKTTLHLMALDQGYGIALQGSLNP